MNDILQLLLKITGGILGLAGLIVVYAAPYIVDKRNLAEKKEIDPEQTAKMNEEEAKKFKRDSAILDVKIKGIMIAMPGFLIILVLFKV